MTIKPKTVTINNITYKVLSAETPEDHDIAGRHNLAREMRKNKQALDLFICKPKGKRVFIATQFESGNFSSVTSMPYPFLTAW